MNFDLPEDLKTLQLRMRRFIAEEVIPMERDLRQTAHGPSESLRLELIEKARRAGLLTPHASVEASGQGVTAETIVADFFRHARVPHL